MDFRNLASDLDRLAAADTLIAGSYLRHVFAKAGIYFVAGGFATVGLAMIEVAAYTALERNIGVISAFAVMGGINLVIAIGVWLQSGALQPGRDFSLALDIRKSTVAAVERDLSAPAGVGSAVASYSTYPLSEAMISSVAVPLIAALVRTLSARRDANASIAPETPDQTGQTRQAGDKQGLAP